MAFKHLFGPVPSRRLGVSLGIDLVPAKVCSQDCIYCEVGKTTKLTLIRKEYVDIQEVILELDEFMGNSPQLDFITFSGAGEPTLNSGLGRLISYIKEQYPEYKLALITNSTLFDDEEMRKELIDIDVMLPSLDAASQDVFVKLNRPCKGLEIGNMIKGLIEMRKVMKGKMWLEIFLSPDINDTAEELKRLKEACQLIKPHSIQLNTLDRPGILVDLKPLTAERLNSIRDYFLPLPVEIIAKSDTRKQKASYSFDIAARILETTRRRPCTDSDLCQILGLHINELNKYIGSLIAENRLQKREGVRGVFYESN